jgi:hypothetical protein
MSRVWSALNYVIDKKNVQYMWLYGLDAGKQQDQQQGCSWRQE